ncbi:Aspartokinase 3, chloroplastic [Zea mays]|uniref:Aspartokinase 3, chloroplastic n=1 Tax=Zea mays TaxID=4577 RepID=A0A3L6G631_MAIZE|nr:Aspartokinase 3, chloroplastic [Zea mays]
MDKVVLTSIVLKSNVTMLDILSTRMLGQYGFPGKGLMEFLEQRTSARSPPKKDPGCFYKELYKGFCDKFKRSRQAIDLLLNLLSLL